GAVVLNLEGEARVAGAVGVRRRRELELVAGDVGDRDEVSGGDRDDVVGERARAGKSRDLYGEQAVRTAGTRRVNRVGEAEVRRGEGVRRVLVGGDGLVRPGGRVVHRGDVERERVRRLVGVLAAIGGPAVVSHLEGEARIAGAVRVRRRREQEIWDVRDGDLVAGQDWVPAQCQQAGRWQRADDHRQER